MGIRVNLFLLGILTSLSVQANSDNPVASAIIGAAMALQIMIFVGLYHLGKYICRAIISEPSIWIQRLIGVMVSVVGYFLLISLLK